MLEILFEAELPCYVKKTTGALLVFRLRAGLERVAKNTENKLSSSFTLSTTQRFKTNEYQTSCIQTLRFENLAPKVAVPVANRLQCLFLTFFALSLRLGLALRSGLITGAQKHNSLTAHYPVI